MFANTNLCVMNFAFPDVCEIPTPVTVIPTPLVNIGISITHVPSQFTVIICGGLAENLVTEGTITDGDEEGLALGVVSETIIAPDRYVLGSITVSIGGVSATHLTSLTLGNEINAVGLTLTPSQICVLILS